jgi:hypothetical protein
LRQVGAAGVLISVKRERKGILSPFFTRKPGEVRGPYPGARNARRSTGIGTPQAARRQRMSSLPGAQLRTGAGTTMAEGTAPLQLFASGLRPA